MEMNIQLLKSLNDELIELSSNITLLSKNPEFASTIVPAMEFCSLILRNQTPMTLDGPQLNEMIRLIYPMITVLSKIDDIPVELLSKTSHLLDELINKTLDFNEMISLLESQGHTLEEVMIMEFEIYQKRKKSHELYSKTDLTPQFLIKQYYGIVDEPRFHNLLGTFKEKYIVNECLVEKVHEYTEQKGMEAMYDYIIEFDKNGFINPFTLQTLHKYLYSKVPYPEFGGSIRNDERFLPGSGVTLVPYEDVRPALNQLFPVVVSLAERGRQLGKHKNPELVLPYINDCIELNCRLIKIHPFQDGNGRTIRAFTNLLFSLANIPPVYIKEKEKEEYGKAMNKALCFYGERKVSIDGEISLNDTTAIKRFYYYKICDSLIDLDVKKRIAETKKLGKNYLNSF